MHRFGFTLFNVFNYLCLKLCSQWEHCLLHKHSLGKHIKNFKTKTKSAVYRLNCGRFNKNYIGRTFKNFGIRLNEHKSCFDKKYHILRLFEQFITKPHIQGQD